MNGENGQKGFSIAGSLFSDRLLDPIININNISNVAERRVTKCAGLVNLSFVIRIQVSISTNRTNNKFRVLELAHYYSLGKELSISEENIRPSDI